MEKDTPKLEDFSREFLDFMEYITNSSDEVAEKSFGKNIKAIHETVRQIRLSEEMGVKYMQKWEERVYDRLEGRTEGKIEGKTDINRLNQALIRDERLEDMLRATVDSEFQEKLLKEYNISA